jgi:anaerobic selenocysteine-containing dehydrogenase
VLARARLGDVVGPGVVALPSGWWASRSPGGTSANALTSEELTDRGGGAVIHAARVEVELLTDDQRSRLPNASAPITATSPR